MTGNRIDHVLIIAAMLCAVVFAGCGRDPHARPDAVTVAVAANFTLPAQELAQRFEAETGITVRLSFASTGKHYTQIINGAPFDVFLAADDEHPRRLEQSHHAAPGGRFTYARGHLVLWSCTKDPGDDGAAFLASGNYNKLSIANPRHAPYGRAARQTLEALSLWEQVQPKLVTGENIGQAHTYVATRNADAGFVAMSQVAAPGKEADGWTWPVPQHLYTPIEQQAVLLRDTPAARQFLDFLRKPESLDLIRQYGYATP